MVYSFPNEDDAEQHWAKPEADSKYYLDFDFSSVISINKKNASVWVNRNSCWLVKENNGGYCIKFSLNEHLSKLTHFKLSFLSGKQSSFQWSWFVSSGSGSGKTTSFHSTNWIQIPNISTFTITYTVWWYPKGNHFNQKVCIKCTRALLHDTFVLIA